MDYYQLSLKINILFYLFFLLELCLILNIYKFSFQEQFHRNYTLKELHIAFSN